MKNRINERMKGMKRRVLLLIFIIIMVFSTTKSYTSVNINDFKEMTTSTTTMAANAFSDIKDSDWFYEAVNKMSQSGIVKGYPDGTFKPNDTVKYAEFVKMFIVAVTGEDIGNSQKGHWAENYYHKGIELGLFTEYDINLNDLGHEIPRKVMALMVSNNFYGTEINNYDAVETSIPDLEDGKPYQHEIIKSYGMGILTGYENGEFRPEGTLTRAESATVINRTLNENERIVPQFETPVADDSYWKKDKQYDEIVEWIANNQNGAVWGGNSSLEDGKVYFTHSDGYKWSADNTNFPRLHECVYFALKTYYNYAINNDMGISIGGNEYQNKITIGLRQNTRTINTMFYFGFQGTPEYLDDNWKDVPNYVRPYVFFSQTLYATNEDVEEQGVDLIIQKERIGNEALVELNRKIFKEVYGEETGGKIADYTIKIYKDSFDVETRELIDLPNPKVTIDGIDIYYRDDSSPKAFYMDKPE